VRFGLQAWRLTLGHFNVIIPTTLRVATLEACLAQLQRAEPPEESTVSVLVIVNGNDAARPLKQSPSKNRFPVTWDYSAGVGKNAALNFGIAKTDGELIVCLDDDVLVDRGYFRAVEDGLRNWPHASIYGGRVLLKWPDCYPGELDENIIQYAGFAFGQADPHFVAGPATDFSPVENNMILVRSAFPLEPPFNPAIGPRNGSYTMGSGEELFRMVRNVGAEIVYLPDALVEHIVRPEQMTIKWLLRRSSYWGMSVDHFKNRHGDIQGDANFIVLFGKFVQRLLSLGRLQFKTELYPSVWAKIDLNVIRGIMHARLNRLFSKRNI
jgi:glycosyltransferase involved in cell wall biosynthesis